MTRQPIVIGIAGPSGSGKSVRACALAERLQGSVLSLDHYYLDLSHLSVEERARCNFDDPVSLDWNLAIGQIESLAAGRAVERPDYDFTTHTRAPGVARLEPSHALIIDGIFALYPEGLRRLYHAAVYVDLPDEVCFARRLERDVHERGRTPESVRHQYAETVRPMCERHVLPAREHANVIVRGDQDIAECVETVVRFLDSLLYLPGRD